MKIIINGDPANDAVQANPDDKFGEVFARLTAHIQSEGRTVTGVEIDGEPLTESLAITLRSRPVKGIGSISVQAADMQEVSQGLLAELRGGLRRLGQAAERLAGLFQASEVDEALKSVTEFIEAWEMLIEGLQQVANMRGLKMKEMTLNGSPLEERLQGMAYALRELVKAFEQRDYVSVGDALAYDIPEQIQLMKEIADALE